MRGLIEVLRSLPPGFLPNEHVAIGRPSGSADLPRVVVSAESVTDASTGIGGTVASRRVADDLWSSDSGSRSTGSFGLELWVEVASDLESLADAVFATLAGPPEALTEAGFLQLRIQSVGPAEPAELLDETETVFLPIGCEFVFESVQTEETGPGGIIRQIHVDVQDEFQEVMDLP